MANSSSRRARARNPKFHGPLPRGDNTFWVRVIFDKDHSVDSAPVTLAVTGRPVDPSWTVRNVGDAKAAFGIWQTGTQGFQFFGNGMHTVTRKITGDFTATCRIDAYNGSRGEPVNRRAWVGLTAREFGEKLNWEWGRDFHLVQTAAEGLRASADFTDFGAGRISSYELPKGRPWLRIVRQGQIWTAWTSADGKQWDLGAYQFKKTRPEMDVGLFFSALPQDARAHYHASVSEVSFQPGVAADSVPPVPPIAQHTAGRRLTGVVDGPLRCAGGGGSILRRRTLSGLRMAARPGRPPMATSPATTSPCAASPFTRRIPCS